MSVELILLWESLLTKVALVRFIPSMNSLVILEVRTFDEALVAKGTLIGLNASYTGVVIAFALLVAEDLTARIALVFFWDAWHYRYVTTITTFDVFALLHDFLIDFCFCRTVLQKKTKQQK